MYETKDQSNFTKGYLQTGVYCRPSCYDCKFKGYPRISDITLADFWGIERVNTSMEKNLGTSLVMINSQKGERYFETAKGRINYVEVPFNSIEAGNRSLNLSVNPPKVDRKQFFEDLDKMSFLQMAEKYIINKKSRRQKLIASLRYLRTVVNSTRLHPKPLYQFFKYNTLSEILRGNVIVPTPYTVIELYKGAKINKHGITVLGSKMVYKHSKLETRLLLQKDATLNLGPDLKIAYGADIEVFKGATLTFKGHGGSNIGLTCICGNNIQIGDGVMMGRHVTIRDNNGSHYINRQGYKNSTPVIIGDKAWLCEQCTIMNGVKIGDGAIVGAKSFVIRNVPAYSMVSGHPAEVVDEEVLWKY